MRNVKEIAYFAAACGAFWLGAQAYGMSAEQLRATLHTGGAQAGWAVAAMLGVLGVSCGLGGAVLVLLGHLLRVPATEDQSTVNFKGLAE